MQDQMMTQKLTLDAAGSRHKVCFVINHSFAFRTLFRGLFPHLTGYGIDCDAVVGDAEYLGEGHAKLADVNIHVIPMTRAPSIVKDLISLVQMIWFFARNRYDVLHISTPKAAFLGAIAGRLTGHKNILFVVRIRIYEDMTGWRRSFFEWIDRCVCALSTSVAPISREMGEAMVRDGICSPEKLVYFGKGSSNGIDTKVYVKDAVTMERGTGLRKSLGIAPDTLVALFIGRLAQGKGVEHIPALIKRVESLKLPVHFVIAGPVDWREPTAPEVLEFIDSSPLVTRLEYQADPAAAFAAADLLLFPSNREGFGNVALEAQAMELAVSGFAIYGVREGVRHGETGLLAAPGDTEGFVDNSIALLTDKPMREKFGKRGAGWVRENFSNEVVWTHLRATLFGMMAQK
ncbi:glycosyltransferase [uncultured Devosia sp.]|uniref:glycosyltransferase n=1 Tax=uncultured Devosia sp. TaxID=211434 RepID=UPI0035CA1B29